MSINPAIQGAKAGESQVQDQPRQKETLSQKQNINKKDEGMAQVVKQLLST
jgi:hypothetical protein